MKQTLKAYIAGPFSTPQEKELLSKMIHVVRSHTNFELYVPMEHKIEGDYQNTDGTWHLPNDIWANKVFNADIEAINDSNFVIAMYAGHRSTTGTSWEIGYAFAKNIPVILYIPDEFKDRDFSLMIMNSATGWIDDNGAIHMNNDFIKMYNMK